MLPYISQKNQSTQNNQQPINSAKQLSKHNKAPSTQPSSREWGPVAEGVALKINTNKKQKPNKMTKRKQKLKIKEEQTVEQNLDIPKVHGFKKISQPRKQKQQQIVQIKNKQCSEKTRNNPTTQQSKSHEPGPLTRRHYQLNWLLHQCMPSYYVDEYHDVFCYYVEIFINHLNGAFSGAHQRLECHRH